jgi:glyceraldehyde 3-phosphate dehydrogenase
MKFSAALSLAAVGSASAYSFSGTSLKAATSNGASMSMATGMGVNGFGRIGRLVTRIIMEDADCKLAAINAGSATPDYSESLASYALLDFFPLGNVL